jgi:DNA-binding YbaB/EbfC family protein
MNPKNMQRLLSEAYKVQEKMQAQLLELRVESTSGGGLVAVVMDGAKRLVSLRINPQAVDPNDVDLLQDLVIAAVNDAGRKVDEVAGSQMSDLSASLLGRF